MKPKALSIFPESVGGKGFSRLEVWVSDVSLQA